MVLGPLRKGGTCALTTVPGTITDAVGTTTGCLGDAILIPIALGVGGYTEFLIGLTTLLAGAMITLVSGFAAVHTCAARILAIRTYAFALLGVEDKSQTRGTLSTHITATLYAFAAARVPTAFVSCGTAGLSTQLRIVPAGTPSAHAVHCCVGTTGPITHPGGDPRVNVFADTLPTFTH